MTTMLHFSPQLGAFTRCKAFSRPGAGVSLCPNFSEGVLGGAHFASMASLAAQGGGQIHRNGRLTTVTPNTDGTFTARTGKLTRVYDAEGKLLKLRERVRQGWTAKERLDAENAAVKALEEAGAYDPMKTNRLSGVVTLDHLLLMDPYEWANTSENQKRSLIINALEDTASSYGVGRFTYQQIGDGRFLTFQPMEMTGQTTFYADKDKEPMVALSSELTTTLSNHTAADAIAKEVAHLIEGHAAGHGPAWQKKVKELREDMGLDDQGNPKDRHRKSLFEKEQTRLYAKNQPHKATCAAGKHTFYRKNMNDARGYCGDCYRETNDPNISLTWGTNPDAGKWRLTKGGLQKLDSQEPEQKKTRGARVKDWRKLPAIKNMDDYKAAMEKMSPELRDNLNGTDYYLSTDWATTKSRANPLVKNMELSADYSYALLKSGATFKEKHLEEFRTIVEENLAKADPIDSERWARRKEALDDYAPDPERVEFVREVRTKLGITN